MGSSTTWVLSTNLATGCIISIWWRIVHPITPFWSQWRAVWWVMVAATGSFIHYMHIKVRRSVRGNLRFDLGHQKRALVCGKGVKTVDCTIAALEPTKQRRLLLHACASVCVYSAYVKLSFGGLWDASEHYIGTIALVSVVILGALARLAAVWSVLQSRMPSCSSHSPATCGRHPLRVVCGAGKPLWCNAVWVKRASG